MTDQSNVAPTDAPAGVQVRDNASRIVSVSATRDAASVQVSNSTGVLATARGRNGRGLDAAGVRGDDLVTVGGMEMTVETAAKEGFLKKLSDGTYAELTEEEVRANQEAADHYEDQHADPDDISVGLDERGTAIVSDIASAVEEAGYPLPTVIAEFLADPTRLPDGIARAAINRGEDLKETLEVMRNVVGSYERFIAQKVVEVAGVPEAMLRDFFQWAAEPQRQQQRMGAVLEVLHSGSIKPWLTMARQFMNSGRAGQAAAAATDRRDAIQAGAGVSVNVDPRTGQRTVRLPNGVVTSELVARRLGLV